MTRRGLAALAVAALVAASCSLTKLAYSNAPFAYANAMPMLAWIAGDYVDLSDEQKDSLRKRLKKAFAWHRAQELPEYRRFLESIAEKSAGRFSADDARGAYRDLRAYYQRTVERVIPDIADLLLQLDAEQVSQLERKFAAANAKLVRESLKGSPEERRENRAARLVGHIEEFTGTLSASQRDLVRERLALGEDLTAERLADRRYRQGETLALIRARVSRERMIAELTRLLLQTEEWRRPAYQEKLRERDERMFEMIAAFSATLTDEQRENLRDRLRGFIRDISEFTASS
ncbi:MAG TPA: DUF6279 family lipoprotein [Usitatibacter sp.]